jgi:hypothetical protein
MYDAVGKRHSVWLPGDGTAGAHGDLGSLIELGFEFYRMTWQEAEDAEFDQAKRINEHFGKITERAKANVLGGKDSINHPVHYNIHPSGVECIQIVRHMSFNLGNAIKYIWRAGLKPGQTDIQDLEKAAWYIADEIERRKNLGQDV